MQPGFYGRKLMDSCQTVEDIVSSNSELSMLKDALQRTGVSTSLQNELADRSANEQWAHPFY
jgi:hypothetical protein